MGLSREPVEQVSVDPMRKGGLAGPDRDKDPGVLVSLCGTSGSRRKTAVIENLPGRERSHDRSTLHFGPSRFQCSPSPMAALCRAA